MSCRDTFMGSSLLDHHTMPNLHATIFGEGIVNDSVTLSLFESIEHTMTGAD